MSKLRKVITVFTLVTALALSCTPVNAAAIPVYLDGKQVDFVDTNAQIINSYTYVPVAKIIEIMTGVFPDWNANTKTASFAFNGSNFKITANQSGMYRDNVFIPYLAPTLIRDSRTLVPLRMMSEVMGFGIDWNANTKTVSLKSPQNIPSGLAAVVSVNPQSANIMAGTVVTVAVTASANTVEAKIVDANNNLVTSSKAFIASGANRQFTMSFTPQTSGSYRAFAASAAGYNQNSYQDVNITIGASPAVNSASLSGASGALNDYLTVTVNTNSETTKVKLASDTNSSDVIESTNYTTSGSSRVFTFNWQIRGSYYSSSKSVSAKIYAGNNSGYTSGYKSVSASIGETVTVHSVTASPSQVSTNSQTSISVATCTNVTRVEFSVSSGGGSIANRSLTRYSDSGGRRYWDNTFSSGSSAGTSRINITAFASGGSSATGSVTITTVAPVATDTAIYNISTETPIVEPNTQVLFTILTGLDVESVSCSNDYHSGTSNALNTGSVSGGRMVWQYYFDAPDSLDADSLKISVSATGYASGKTTGAKSVAITVKYEYSINQ